MRKKTHEEYVAELAIKNPNIEVIGKYLGDKIKIEHHCLIHGIYWYAMPSNVLRGKGCKICQKEKFHNSRTKTHREYVEKLKQLNPNIIAIEDYIDSKTSILHKCLIDGYEWNARPSNILSGRGCPKCSKEKQIKQQIKDHNQYVNEILKINPNIEVLEKYSGANIPIFHKCKIHNVKWKTIPTSILRGSGCYKCGMERSIKSKRKTHLQYVKEVKQLNCNIKVLDQYINDSTIILHKCLIDGHEWLAKPNNILNGYGCPKCNESKGEKQIASLLDSKYVAYERQKKFKDCCDINPLPFDFYLPDYNMAIEYDGLQHFKPIKHFGGNKAFEYTFKHDKIKNEYCKNNGISLLRIPYYKNVEEELNNFLFI